MKKMFSVYWICIALVMAAITVIPHTTAQEPSGGLIAFAANRGAYMDIYTMRPDGSDIKRLTEETPINHSPAWSPDGTQIAYIAFFKGEYDLYLMDADGRHARRVETDDPQPKYDVSWSPDGTQLAYQGRLETGQFTISILTIATSETRPLVAMADIQGLEWSPDGTHIAFASPVNNQLDLYLIDVESSELTHLTKSKDREGFPAWSPDGRQILVTSNDASLNVISREGETERRLSTPPELELKSTWSAIWSPDGAEIAFIGVKEDAEGGDLYLMDPDGENIRQITIEGDLFGDLAWHPKPVVTPVEEPIIQTDSAEGFIAFAAEKMRSTDIYTILPDGNTLQRLTTEFSFNLGPVWSPDGNQIAYISFGDSENYHTDIYIMDADGQNLRFLQTKDLNEKTNPAWSPDGTEIAYLSRKGNQEIYIISIANIARGESRAVMEAPEIKSLIWSPDGRFFAYSRVENGQSDVYLFDIEENRETQLTNDASWEVVSDWSSDGTKILFVAQTILSDSKRSVEIYSMAIDGSDRKKLVDAGWWASWSPDDSEIAYISHEEDRITGNLYVMDVESGAVRQITAEGNIIGRVSWQPVADSNPDSEVVDPRR